MKILCLHGMGLNSNLMQKQLARITASLDPSYELCFVDGEIEWPAAPAVPKDMPGPFYAYYDDLLSENIRAACDLLEVVIEDEGPFEGFIGFSQGAALAMSYMIDRARSNPKEECPFRWALFFSANLPFAPDPDYMALEIALYRSKRDERGKKLDKSEDGVKGWEHTTGDTTLDPYQESRQDRHKILASQEELETFVAEYVGLIRAMCVFGDQQGGYGCAATFDQSLSADPDTTAVPRFYHPVFETTLIDIPTIHCIGMADHRDNKRQFAVVRGLCEERTAMSIEHRGGHEIPRDSEATLAIVSALKKAIEDSRWSRPRALI